MVSIEYRYSYLQSIENNDLLKLFQTFLNLKIWSGPFQSELNEMNQICFNCVKAIINNSQLEFNNTYNIISKKLPNKNSNSPFVHNDYLIFTLIVGIVKFKLDKIWIGQVLNVRANNDITKTFQNLINGDYNSKQNIYAIVVCLLNITKSTEINIETLNNAYVQIANNIKIFDTKSDFIKLCSLTTYDLIILSRTPIDSSNYETLKKFEKTFFSRTKMLSYLVYNLLLIGLFLVIYKILIRYPEIREKADYLGLIIGILGISIGNYITSIRIKIQNLIMILFGHASKREAN